MTEPSPERPIPFAIALLVLAALDIRWLYRLAETPFEFMAILGLLGVTFITAVETLARIE